MIVPTRRAVPAVPIDIRETLADNQDLRNQVDRNGRQLAATYEAFKYDATLQTLAYGEEASSCIVADMLTLEHSDTTSSCWRCGFWQTPSIQASSRMIA